MGRKAVGIELKESYYDMACRNVKSVDLQKAQLSIF